MTPDPTDISLNEYDFVGPLVVDSIDELTGVAHVTQLIRTKQPIEQIWITLVPCDEGAPTDTDEEVDR